MVPSCQHTKDLVIFLKPRNPRHLVAHGIFLSRTISKYSMKCSGVLTLSLAWNRSDTKLVPLRSWKILFKKCVESKFDFTIKCLPKKIFVMKMLLYIFTHIYRVPQVFTTKRPLPSRWNYYRQNFCVTAFSIPIIILIK